MVVDLCHRSVSGEDVFVVGYEVREVMDMLFDVSDGSVG